jgi:phosphatidylinositol alpha-1,6-mannosyltransferase
MGSVMNALLLPRPPADVILFWHIGMLKLLPFLRCDGARIVVYLHGIECWKTFDGLAQHLLARVDLFLCGTEFSLGRFLHYNPTCERTPNRVIPLGVDESEPGATLPDSPPAALIVGRIARSEDYKGHRQLIGAWPLVQKHTSDAELWIVGTGDLEPELKTLVPPQATKAVRFYGRISDDQKNDLLRRCRCFVMPSEMEGFGLVYLEAMRMGRPCLVNSIGAGLEVVRPPEAGLAVDPNNRVELAQTVSRLLGEGPDWDGWSEGARRRYEGEFTERDFQDRLVNVLREVHSKRK